MEKNKQELLNIIDDIITVELADDRQRLREAIDLTILYRKGKDPNDDWDRALMNAEQLIMSAFSNHGKN